MRILEIRINCGETTCAIKKGKFCEWFSTKKFGQIPYCKLFNTELIEENGWTKRCDECIMSERKKRQIEGVI